MTVYTFLQVDPFIHRCLKFKHEMEVVKAQYKAVYKEVQITFPSQSLQSPHAARTLCQSTNLTNCS
jgi:hypothetical protein